MAAKQPEGGNSRSETMGSRGRKQGDAWTVRGAAVQAGKDVRAPSSGQAHRFALGMRLEISTLQEWELAGSPDKGAHPRK